MRNLFSNWWKLSYTFKFSFVGINLDIVKMYELLHFYLSKYNNLEFLSGFMIDLELTSRGKTIRDRGWSDKTRFSRRGRSKEVYTCFTIVLPDFSITEAFDASCVRTACKSCFCSWYSHDANTSSWKQYDFSSICLASRVDSVFILVLYEYSTTELLKKSSMENSF
mgnify:CR=1 FL=1